MPVHSGSISMLLALLGGAGAASPSPPALPCTVDMLKLRPAGDKSWPVACSQTTLGESYEELDLSGAHLSYGDFEGATFTGSAIKLIGAGLANADLSDSTFTASAFRYDGLIDFTDANLTNADLSGSELSASAESYEGVGGDASIDLTGATLANADLSNLKLTADGQSDTHHRPLCDQPRQRRPERVGAHGHKPLRRCRHRIHRGRPH